MATSDKIVIDSNYLIAIFNPEDTLRERALELATFFEQEECRIIVSSLVFLEAVTVLSQRRGREVAIRAGEYVQSRPDVRWLFVDEDLYNTSWEIFKNTNYKNISLTDCSVVATAKAEGVREILTFDQADFKKLQKKFSFRIVN